MTGAVGEVRKPRREPGAVQTIENALAVLEAFDTAGREYQLRELSEATGLSKSTVHRVLRTLIAHSYVSQSPTSGAYRLGVRLLRFANYLRSDSDLVRTARPRLEELVQRCGETVMLAVLDGVTLIYLDTLEPSALVRLARYPDATSPPHGSSMGKVLLAHADEGVVDELLTQPLEAFTAATIVDADAFKKELARIRKQGFARNTGERTNGVRAIGVPLFSSGGRCLAAISIAGPEQRMNDARMKELLPMVQDTAYQISVSLGYGEERDERTGTRANDASS